MSASQPRIRVVDAEGRSLTSGSTAAHPSPHQATPMAGYVRVSTEEQGRSGLGLEAQEAAIRRATAERGWRLVALETDVASGTSRRRPGLDAVLARCRAGEAEGLVVAKLDRLSRSLLDFATLVEEARRRDFAIVALDSGFDLTTPTGRAMANMLATFAELERDFCSERTRAALAEAKRRGVQLGRPSLLPDDVRLRVVRLRRSGLSLRAIAARLNAERVPAAAGGQWGHTSVREVVLRAERAAERAAA